MKTTHTLQQLKTEKGFPVNFGGEEVKWNTINYFKMGETKLKSRVMEKDSYDISYGYHIESDSVMIENPNYTGVCHYLIPLSEFERLGMIKDSDPFKPEVIGTVSSAFKYPISDIRSGKIAVKLTDIEQFKKIAPEQKQIKGHYIPNLYHACMDFEKMLSWMSDDYVHSSMCKETLIDFSQIEWGEEVKEETTEVKKDIKPYPFYAYASGYYQNNCAVCKNTFTGDKLARMCLECAIVTSKTELEQLRFQLQAADAENERLSNRVEQLEQEMNEAMNQLKLRQSTPHPTESELDRKAWEIYVSGFNHGIADKWTIAECYRTARIFIDYRDKGGENE